MMVFAGADADNVDPLKVPALSLFLGFGPMLPIVGAGIVAIMSTDPIDAVAIVGGTGWASAILLFVAGVRRGYGFAVRATPRLVTLAVTLGIFLAGLLAMPIFLLAPVIGVAILIAGFLAVAIADPVAARRGEAPRHFARLRPLQMALGLTGLLLLEAACLHL
ncbi:DUF3429 domain-containing protein [Sphingomonas crocodyli]|uniref:DUF3429 domain-containing protein n=1 Tax=Sphingomonas crocodyli TaxID=1979270 RepID=UPI0013E28A07